MFRIAELCRRIDVEAKDGQGARRVIKTTQRDSGNQGCFSARQGVQSVDYPEWH